jgi:DNA polymerase-3 subunit epsilon
MTRQLIVCDIETTCLQEHGTPVPLEIAAVNVDTGSELYFVPHVTPAQLAAADPVSLQINRYFERGVFRDMLDVDATKKAYEWLRDMLRDTSDPPAGHTFAGSNPTFDTQVLQPHTGRVWHHRLADLAAYAAPRMERSLTDLPGQNEVCEFLGVPQPDQHSALGDALAAAECFRLLRAWYTQLALATVQP